MFIYVVNPDGTPVVARPNPAIPNSLLLQIHNLVEGGMTWEDAVKYVRGKLVPEGYQPYPFKRNTQETLLYSMRSLVATYLFRHTVNEYKADGVDFSLYVYTGCIKKTTLLEKYLSILIFLIFIHVFNMYVWFRAYCFK